jgi:hypothetical protein
MPTLGGQYLSLMMLKAKSPADAGLFALAKSSAAGLLALQKTDLVYEA